MKGHLLILFLLWCLQEEINAFSSISWHNLGIVVTWIFSSWIKYRFQTKVLFMLFGLKMMYSLVNIYNQWNFYSSIQIFSSSLILQVGCLTGIIGYCWFHYQLIKLNDLMTVFPQDFLLQHCRPRSTTSVKTLRATHTGHMGQSYYVFSLLRDVTHHLEKTVSTVTKWLSFKY